MSGDFWVFCPFFYWVAYLFLIGLERFSKYFRYELFVGYGPACMFSPPLLALWHSLLPFYPLLIPFQLLDFLFLEYDELTLISGFCTSSYFCLECFPPDIRLALPLTSSPAARPTCHSASQAIMSAGKDTHTGSYWFLEHVAKSNITKSNFPKQTLT